MINKYLHSYFCRRKKFFKEKKQNVFSNLWILSVADDVETGGELTNWALDVAC